MYLYQDYIRLGEALRNEMDMNKRIDKTNGEYAKHSLKSLSGLESNKTFQSDTRQILDSFNPLCSICNSNLCTSAFNPTFKTCSHHAKP